MTVSYRPVVTVEGTLVLNEDELGALDALVGYGTDSFLRVFYEKMGRAYLEPHEAGLRGLFEKIRDTAPPALGQVRELRRDIRAAKEARAEARGKTVPVEATEGRRGLTIKPMFAWYDIWVGAFWDQSKRKLYLFPLPMVGIVVEFPRKVTA